MKTLKLLIYDIVGDRWDGVTAKDVARQLAEHDDVDTIEVAINSVGGSVFDGLAIYNALRRHPATVNVHVDGVALSIASVIAQAGQTRTIAPTGQMMVHNPFAWAAGDASELRRTADQLDVFRDTLADVYAEVSGMPASLWHDLMRAETWFTAREAISYGLADQVHAAAQAATAQHRPQALAPGEIYNAAARQSGRSTTVFALDAPARPPRVPVARELTAGGLVSPPPRNPDDTPMADNSTGAWNRVKQFFNVNATDEFEALDELRQQAQAAQRVPTLEAQLAELKTQLAGAQAAKAQAEQRAEALEQAEDERLVTEAVASFRIPKAQEQKYRDDLQTDRTGTRKVLASLQPGSARPQAQLEQPDGRQQGGDKVVEITRSEARNAVSYRAAKARAEKDGAELIIVEDE